LSDNNRCIGIDTNYVHWLSGGNLRVERDNIGTACRVALSKTTTAENKPRRVCTQKVPVQRSRSRKRPMEQTGCIPVNNGNDCLWVLRQRGGDHERSGTCSGAHGARGPERTNERTNEGGGRECLGGSSAGGGRLPWVGAAAARRPACAAAMHGAQPKKGGTKPRGRPETESIRERRKRQTATKTKDPPASPALPRTRFSKRPPRKRRCDASYRREPRLCCSNKTNNMRARIYIYTKEKETHKTKRDIFILFFPLVSRADRKTYATPRCCAGRKRNDTKRTRFYSWVTGVVRFGFVAPILTQLLLASTVLCAITRVS